jgi:signal transduction histidine kinase
MSLLTKIQALEDKRQRIFAFVLVSMACVDFLSGLATIAMGQKFLGIIFVSLALAFGLVFLPLQMNGFSVLSRIAVPYYAAVVLFIAASYYGPNANVQISIFIGAIYPFIVFEPTDRKYILACLPAPLLFLLGVELTNYSALQNLLGDGSQLHEFSTLTRLSMTVTAFFIVNATLLMFSYQNGKYEEKLQAANHNLDTLIRTICHDIRNPLMVSIGYTSLLKKNIDPSQDKPVGAIIRANNQIQRIINSVIEMQKLKGGKFKINIESVRLKAVFDECLFTLQNIIEEKGVTINFQTQDELYVKGNLTLLAQSVINNILSNAIKFSPKDSVIDIAFKRVENGSVSIKITDRGIGIPKPLLEKIFDPSAKTTRLGTNAEKGTGFGLPIAKAYLEAMGGDIKVTSKTKDEDSVNHGTSFEILMEAV